jgi:hypothetical protein
LNVLSADSWLVSFLLTLWKLCERVISRHAYPKRHIYPISVYWYWTAEQLLRPRASVLCPADDATLLRLRHLQECLCSAPTRLDHLIIWHGVIYQACGRCREAGSTQSAERYRLQVPTHSSAVYSLPALPRDRPSILSFHRAILLLYSTTMAGNSLPRTDSRHRASGTGRLFEAFGSTASSHPLSRSVNT